MALPELLELVHAELAGTVQELEKLRDLVGQESKAFVRAREMEQHE